MTIRASSTSSRWRRRWLGPEASRTARSGSRIEPRGAAITASCAGPRSARASPTDAGRDRCARPSSRLAAGIDAVTDGLAAELPGTPDPWAARDAYVDVVIGADEPAAFARRWLGDAGGHGGVHGGSSR